MLALVSQGNRVGSEGLQSIAQALLGNTALKELVLCDNTIGAVSAGGGGADDVCLSVSVNVPSSTPLRVVAGPPWVAPVQSADPAMNRQALSTLGDVLLSERAALCRVRPFQCRAGASHAAVP